MLYNNATINSKDIVVFPIHDKFGELDRSFKPGDYVKHFKGNLCRIIGEAIHTETNEELIVYEKIDDGKRQMFAHPRDMFVSLIDRVKYPDSAQDYRFIKVYLEKKSASNALTSVTFTQETAMTVLIGVRQFLHSFIANNNEQLQYWISGADSTATLRMQRPDNNLNFLRSIKGEASLHQTIKFGKIIQFHAGEAKETIKPGDTVHFVREYRMVVENTEENLYEFFEIVPCVKDLY